MAYRDPDYMKKTVAFIGIVVILFFASAGAQSEGTVTKLYEGDLFKVLWETPWEMAMVVFNDGKWLIATQELEHMVAFPVEHIEQKYGRVVSDIVFFVHSHIDTSGFSEQDVKTFWKLYDRGFRGHYILVMPGGRTLEYKYKVKK